MLQARTGKVTILPGLAGTIPDFHRVFRKAIFVPDLALLSRIVPDFQKL